MNYKPTYKALIDRSWNSYSGRTNWTELESVLVAVLRDMVTVSDTKVALCKEAIDAYTRRSYFSAEEYHQTEVE